MRLQRQLYTFWDKLGCFFYVVWDVALGGFNSQAAKHPNPSSGDFGQVATFLRADALIVNELFEACNTSVSLPPLSSCCTTEIEPRHEDKEFIKLSYFRITMKYISFVLSVIFMAMFTRPHRWDWEYEELKEKYFGED